MANERGDRSTVQKYLEVASVLVCPLTSNVDVPRSGIADRDGRHGFQGIADRASTTILNFFLRDDDDFFGFPKAFYFDVIRTNVRGLQFDGIVFIVTGGGTRFLRIRRHGSQKSRREDGKLKHRSSRKRRCNFL